MHEVIKKFDVERHMDNNKFRRAFLILFIGIGLSLYYLPVLVIPIIIIFFILIYKSIDTQKLINEK